MKVSLIQQKTYVVNSSTVEEKSNCRSFNELKDAFLGERSGFTNGSQKGSKKTGKVKWSDISRAPELNKLTEDVGNVARLQHSSATMFGYGQSKDGRGPRGEASFEESPSSSTSTAGANSGKSDTVSEFDLVNSSDSSSSLLDPPEFVVPAECFDESSIVASAIASSVDSSEIAGASNSCKTSLVHRSSLLFLHRKRVRDDPVSLWTSHRKLLGSVRMILGAKVWMITGCCLPGTFFIVLILLKELVL